MTVTRSKTRAHRAPKAALFAALAAVIATPAAALEFELFDTSIRVDNLFTVGAQWRMQDRDNSLIGKSTLFALNNPDPRLGLCLQRTAASHNPGSNPTPNAPGDSSQANNAFEAGAIGAVCATSGDHDGNGAGSANTFYVAAPGAYSPNGDNGNLNFDLHDIVHATAKLTTDISFTAFDFNVFVRPIYFFDANYTDFTEVRPDSTLQAAELPFNKAAEDSIGSSFDVLDYNISKVFTVGERDVSFKLGNQVLNWGESALLFLNSLNSINPPNAIRARIPGFDLKEAFQPQGMLVMSTDVIENVSLETFYQYEWKPLIIDPVGSFQSVSDTLGAGGHYAMLSFAKAPEDPGFAVDDPRYPAGFRGYYRPIDTCSGAGQCVDALGLLGSTASRTIYRNFAEEARRRPDDGGQYGAALKLFLEDFNNGTELAFYAANYHSRLPVVSGIAALDSCIGDDGTASVATFTTDCDVVLGTGAAAGNEPIPVDTAQLLVEYPEDIKMYGLSFNTTVGDYAFSGEYAFRENLPIQIHTVDLTFSLLQPAFPDQDFDLTAAVIPGKQSAFPTFLPQYRGMSCAPGEACIQAGDYVRGYESLKVGQTGLTVLRLIGGDNPIAASQMTLLLEMGWTQVFDMPGLDQIQFQGAGVDTHISGGSDGTAGVEPAPVAGNSRANTLRQNPTAANPDNFGDADSYGYRILNLNRWDSALFGANIETLSIIQHDVKGTTPGIGGNFVEGRKQYAFGVRFDYLSTYIGEVRYTWFTGASGANSASDRDNVFVTLGVQF